MGLDYYLHLFDMQMYREKVLPAYQAFFENDDANALIALLNEVVHKLDTGTPMPHPDIWTRGAYEEAIGILQGTVFYSPKGEPTAAMKGKKTTRGARRIFVKNNLAYILVLALCVPRDKGVDPEQNMGRTRLIPYLYERSEWIEELFTSIRKVRGGSLEIPLGESPSQVFSKEDLREFSAELAKVPPPEGDNEIKERELRKQYDNLRTMLRIASDDADLTLILSLL